MAKEEEGQDLEQLMDRSLNSLTRAEMAKVLPRLMATAQEALGKSIEKVDGMTKEGSTVGPCNCDGWGELHGTAIMFPCVGCGTIIVYYGPWCPECAKAHNRYEDNKA